MIKDFINHLGHYIVPLHRAGWPFIAIFAAVTFLFFFMSGYLGLFGVVMTAWCVYFFRDPKRVVPTREGLVISPADGVVQSIIETTPPTELGMPAGLYTRIAIFMNPFNVHVNRMPITGTVEKLAYTPGKFFNASLDKASIHNERHGMRLKTADGLSIGCVQIAGLIARRILCETQEGTVLSTGDRYGMIRFGSRVDVYLPHALNPLVVEGQTTVAGETVLADIQSHESPRHGALK